MASISDISSNPGALAALRRLNDVAQSLPGRPTATTDGPQGPSGQPPSGVRDSYSDTLSGLAARGPRNDTDSLVDPDLGAESARLIAEQVAQRLSTQQFGIANVRPANVLGLFR